MLSTSECLLKAENFLLAARMAPPAERMAYLEMSAEWRQLAFQIQMERFGPLGSASQFYAVDEEGHDDADGSPLTD